MFRWLRQHKKIFLVPILVLLVSSFSFLVQQCVLKFDVLAGNTELNQKKAHKPSDSHHSSRDHQCCSNAESSNSADAYCCDLNKLTLDNLVVTTTKEDPFKQFDSIAFTLEYDALIVNAGTAYSSAFPDQSRILTHRKLTMRNLVLLD